MCKCVVDEAGHDDLAGDVDHLPAFIAFNRPDDRLAADSNIGFNKFAGDQIEETPTLQHDVRRLASGPLIDAAFEVGHAASPILLFLSL